MRKRISRLIYTSFLFICFSVIYSCASLDPHDMRGLTSMPVKEAIAQPSVDQKTVLDKEGKPHAAWRGPLGVITWVYCSNGIPVLLCDFDKSGWQIGGGTGGNQQLCSKSTLDEDRSDNENSK